MMLGTSLKRKKSANLNTPKKMLKNVTDEQWKEFQEIGYVKIGNIGPEALRRMQTEIDEIMLGRAPVDYGRMYMQLDRAVGGDMVGAPSKGFKEASLNYRKIQDLEYDPVFLEFLQRPIFADICARAYGQDAPIAVYRTMFMNKPSNTGSFLPWHQDRWQDMDRDPQVTVWTALDPATKANGCVQVIPKSHRFGLINPTDIAGRLSEAQAAAICTPDRVVYLELEPGDSVLLHNHTLHASDINRTTQSRRALSVCYMDARTLEKNAPITYPTVFGPGALTVAGVTKEVALAA